MLLAVREFFKNLFGMVKLKLFSLVLAALRALAIFGIHVLVLTIALGFHACHVPCKRFPVWKRNTWFRFLVLYGFCAHVK